MGINRMKEFVGLRVGDCGTVNLDDLGAVDFIIIGGDVFYPAEVLHRLELSEHEKRMADMRSDLGPILSDMHACGLELLSMLRILRAYGPKKRRVFINALKRAEVVAQDLWARQWWHNGQNRY